MTEIDKARNEGREDFRDVVICYIIGMQNDYPQDSGQYMSLQKLLMQIIDRHGDVFTPYRD